MKNEIEKRKNGAGKTFLAAVLMLGAVTGIFQGMTQVTVSAESSKVTTLPTNYLASAGTSTTAQQTKKQDGYVKPNYTVVNNDLESYRNSKPTANDISRDKAAEIGAKALWSVFNLDLNGKTIEMGYNAAHDTVRAKWSGEFWVDGKKGPEHPVYGFTVDAITGEVCAASYGRIIDAKVDLSYDAKLANAPTAMENTAKQYAEKLNVVGGAVKSSTIDSQGYSYNDPTVSFDIVGENGQLAIIQLSRYDKALLAVIYNGYVVEENATSKQIEKEIEKEIAEMQKAPKGSGTDQLEPISK